MVIDRRLFLRAAGLGVTASALAACGAGQPLARSSPSAGISSATTTSATGAATPATPRAIDYAALRARLTGWLITPDQPRYASVSHGFNPLFDSHQPAAVAGCATAADVQACVRAAAGAGTPIAARSGGHSYLGRSTPDGGLVVDLGQLSTVNIQSDGTAVIGPGARLGDVYPALAAAGRALPGGTCPTVGIAGLATGGGIGVLARAYGLTCDHLVAAAIVTAEGNIRTVSANNEPDLFWALRGGGGGNFGIVTSLRFATVPAPDITVFSLGFPGGSAAAVLDAWQHWIAQAPAELWSTCNVTCGDSPSAQVVGSFVGTPDGLAPRLAALTGQVQPSSRFVSARSCLAAMRYFAGGGARESFVGSSRILRQPVSGSRLAQACGRAGMSLLFDSLGGAVGRIAADATPFPHRSALATVQIYQNANGLDPAAATDRVTATRDQLTGMLGAGAYVNYLDATTPPSDYYGANLGRLRQVAAHYDPDGMFAKLG
jgi:FAD/FMN-containing dehydrogenase